MPEKMVAVLMDAGYLWKINFNLFGYKEIGGRQATIPWDVDKFISLAHACVESPEESLFRVFFYDCLPYDGVSKNPLSKKLIDYKKGDFYRERCELLTQLSKRDYIALRKGTLKLHGWTLKRNAIKALMHGRKSSIDQSDLKENLEQKSVDMKMGLDVAWLSSRRIVDKIIIIGGDTDYIPAMKHARREGVQVVIVGFPCLCKRPGKIPVHPDLLEHADLCRLITFENGMFQRSTRSYS